MIASVRHHVRIARPADEVWAIVGDAARVHEWFDGIVACEVEGDRRTIHTATGLPIPEQVTVCDPILRRFQYRIDAPLVAFHRSTIDVLALGEDECIVQYGVEADPRTMALVIGGGARDSLDHLKQTLEASGGEEP